MNAWLNLLDGPLAQRIAMTIVHSLWQGALLAAVVALMLRLAPQRHSTLRYGMSCGGMVAILAASLGTFMAIGQPAPSADAGAQPMPLVAAQPTRAALPADGAAVPAAAAPASSASAQLPIRWIVLAWFVGVLALACWHACGWIWLQRLRRRQPVLDQWQPIVQRLARRLGVRRVVRILGSGRISCPCVIGIIKPVIIVPVALLNGLTPGQVEAILAHELAHVRRHDYLINLIQAAIETVMFYHPAVWWISSRIRRERENCCDDIAARICGSGAAYAESLVALEERRPLPLRLAMAVGGGPLLARVRRLLNLPEPRPVNPVRSLAAAGIALACLCVPLLLSQRVSAEAQLATASATAPATSAPDPDEIKNLSPIQPEDLIAKAEDYRIAGNDLLTVSIQNIAGQGVETVKSVRVSEPGEVSIPLVGLVKVAGLTAVQAEEAIAKALRDKKGLAKPAVSVTVAEARARTFSILGSVGRPGQYQILQTDFRVLDALVLAGGVDPSGIGELHVIRPQAPGRRRTIAIPIAALLNGDLKGNIVIRPGDMLLARQPKKQFLRVVITKAGLLIDGKPVTWAELDKRLTTLPEAERQQTVLAVSVGDPDMPVSTYFEAESKLIRRVQEYKLAHYSNVGIAPTTRPAVPPPSGESQIPGQAIPTSNLLPQQPATKPSARAGTEAALIDLPSAAPALRSTEIESYSGTRSRHAGGELGWILSEATTRRAPTTAKK